MICLMFYKYIIKNIELLVIKKNRNMIKKLFLYFWNNLFKIVYIFGKWSIFVCSLEFFCVVSLKREVLKEYVIINILKIRGILFNVEGEEDVNC